MKYIIPNLKYSKSINSKLNIFKSKHYTHNYFNLNSEEYSELNSLNLKLFKIIQLTRIISYGYFNNTKLSILMKLVPILKIRIGMLTYACSYNSDINYLCSKICSDCTCAQYLENSYSQNV